MQHSNYYVKGVPFVKKKVYESKGALLVCEKGNLCQEKGIWVERGTFSVKHGT